MEKKLTRRQRDFLSKFLDLYHKMDVPIHYGTLAEHLSISNVTAYEMLRLLEQKGLIETEYHLADGKRGPGRAEVYFIPTKKAENLLNKLSGGNSEIEEWDIVKKNIINQLQEGKAEGYESLLKSLLSRIPECHSPLIFITEMITVIILTIYSIQDSIEDQKLYSFLSRIGLPGEIGLLAFSGIGISLSVIENVNLQLSNLILAESGKFSEIISQLSEDNQAQLTKFARTAMKLVNS